MKLLILLSRIPYPLEKGDKLRAYHQIKVLSKHHSIILVASGEKNDPYQKAREALSPYCDEIHFFHIKKITRLWNSMRFFVAGKPLQTGFFYSKQIRKLITHKSVSRSIDHLYCQLFRTAEIVKDINVLKTIDYQDAFSSSMKKRMQATRGFIKWLLWIEYKRVKRYEKQSYRWFDQHTVISEDDRERMGLPRIKIIRNGVDAEYFNLFENKNPRHDLIFTGNMSYLPNVHAAEFLVRKIMPLIWAERPDTTLVLAGASPVKRVQRLAGKNVIITGWIEDIRQAYKDARVFIAPMQIGTGLQNKILEAMAMELPCITSEATWNPIGAKKDDEILVADSPEQYAQKALYLLDRHPERVRIGNNARRFILARFDWKACTEQLVELIR